MNNRAVPPRARRVRPPTVAVTVLLTFSLALGGCSGSGTDGQAPATGAPATPAQALPLAETTVVQAAPEMFRAQPYAGSGIDLLPAAPGVPYAFAAPTAAPLAGAKPVAWLSDNGVDWTSVDVDPAYQGGFSGGMVGSDAVSAVVGTSFEDRALLSRVWTSADRRAWTPVDLPADFARKYRVTVGAAAGGTVYVAGGAPNKDAAVAIIDGSRIEHVKLPDITAPEQRTLVSMAAFEDRVVLVARLGAEGEPGAKVAYASDDGGVTWSGPETLVDAPTAFVAGLAWSGDRFVATGAAPAENADALVPAAWSSPDGRDWVREDVPRPPDDSVFYIAEGVNVWLSKPTARDGRVHAVAGNLDSPRAGFYERAPEGTWAFTGVSGVNAFPGTEGLTVPVNPQDRLAVLGAFGTGLVTMGVAPREGEWKEHARTGALEETARVEALFQDGDRTLVQTERVRYRTDDGNFTGIPESAVYQLGAEPTLTRVEWDPPEIGQLTGLVAASDGGATALLGAVFNPETSTAQGRGWFRAGPDAAWAPVQGLDGAGDVAFHRVTKAGDRWIAVGEVAAPEPGAPWRAQVWTSADGLAWRAAGDTLAAADRASGALDVCAVPGGSAGDVLVAGYADNDDDRRAPAVWRSAGDGFERVEAEIFGTGEGTVTRCASDGRTAVLAASTGGRNIVIRTEDGEDFEGVFRTEFGAALTNPVAVPGGFAAAGRFNSDTAAGPAVWLSKDGRDWHARAVPSVADGSTTFVVGHGEDLVVTMGSDLGQPVQLLPQVAKVIAGL